MNFKRLKQILIKELLFYWVVASILLCFIFIIIESIEINKVVYLTNYTFLICSFISIVLSKYIYEKYLIKYYTIPIKKEFD
jgi:hypothetical protein